MSDDNRFRMTIDLNVLDHLADGLYSSVAAVVTETVANAWDADATEVNIELGINDDRIVIRDNGIGMDTDAINDHYLRVGYRRRVEGDTTSRGRPVMGRKGIGKLSLLSIANIIEIQSAADGAERAALRIVAGDLRHAMESGEAEYTPEEIAVDEESVLSAHGTCIKITSLKRERLRDMATDSLRRRLARRFSIIGSDDFKVFVDGTEVTSADREDLKFVQYLWVFGETEVDTTACEELTHTNSLNDRLPTWDPDWTVRGWIGTVDRPRRLATPEGNLNSIIALARGRLVDEDLMGRIAGAEVYTNYLTGQIEADFLDLTSEGDIVTSNRQRVIEDDARVAALVDFLRRELRTIADRWNSLRATDKVSELQERFPRVSDWIETLPEGWSGKAEKLLERIATMDVGQEGEEEEAQRTLLRHAVFGFERLRLRGDAEELEIALAEGC